MPKSLTNGGCCQAEPLPAELYTPAGDDSTCQNQTEDVAKYTLLLVVTLHVKIKWRTLPSWTLANRAIHSCWWWFYMSKSNGGRCQVYTPAGGDSACQNQTEDVTKLNPCQQSWWWFYNASHLQMEDVAKPSPCQQSCPPLPTEFPFGGFSTLHLKNTVKDAKPVYCGNWHGNNKMWWEINFLLWHHLSNSTHFILVGVRGIKKGQKWRSKQCFTWLWRSSPGTPLWLRPSAQA